MVITLLFSVLLTVGLLIYFIPSFIAYSAKKRNADAILVLNLFLGWTFVGWVIAFAWAVYKD